MPFTCPNGHAVTHASDVSQYADVVEVDESQPPTITLAREPRVSYDSEQNQRMFCNECGWEREAVSNLGWYTKVQRGGPTP